MFERVLSQIQVNNFLGGALHLPVVNYWAQGAQGGFTGDIIARGPAGKDGRGLRRWLREGSRRWLVGLWNDEQEGWEDVHVVDFSRNWGKSARKVKRAASREARRMKRELRIDHAAQAWSGPARGWAPEE